LQHGVAVALIKGDFWLEDVQAETLNLPQLVKLRQLVQVRANKRWTHAYPAHYGASIQVDLKNGQCIEAALADAPGDPENPLSETELLAKNERVMIAAQHAPHLVKQLIDACSKLPESSSMRDVWRALDQCCSAKMP
jgi:2-methylcitrate dehydratase PrpD